MLSYRHAFHAGNFADVLKHSVLVFVIEYFKNKDKGFSYIDSHSGAGIYSLIDESAQKTGEYKDGIDKLIKLPQEQRGVLAPYIELIERLNNSDELTVYPGSPGIARNLLRRQDVAQLFEIHPTDFDLLSDYVARWKQGNVHKKDGYQGLVRMLPPPSRRGIVLIDPPYEIKTDYLKSVDAIEAGLKKFATGCFILWYPVVKRSLVQSMEQAFLDKDIKNVLKVEFCLTPDTEEYGMTGTGLFIVNPPWQLREQSESVLNLMQEHVGNSNSNSTVIQLTEE